MTTAFRRRPRLTLPSKSAVIAELRKDAILLAGILLGVVSYTLFQIPHDISWGGIGGIAIIINHFTGFTIGTVFYLLTLPMVLIGYFTMGGWRFVVRSLFVAGLFSLLTDLSLTYLPPIFDPWPITDSKMLAAVFGGIVGGLSGGLIFRSGTTFPGSSLLSRLLNKRMGIPLSTAYILIDGATIIGMGALFGWEASLYGFLMLIVGGFATDYALEGPSTTRTATVVTNYPKAVSNALIGTLGKGVSYWEITGAYTGEHHFMLTTTILRSQMDEVSRTVAQIDPAAFVTIGISHKAHGGGFRPLR